MTANSLPKGVITLGLVSLLMDLSSEMIHGLLPIFMVTVLGAGALSVGLIGGIAEATASIAKVFSGVISDWIGRRIGRSVSNKYAFLSVTLWCRGSAPLLPWLPLLPASWAPV